MCFLAQLKRCPQTVFCSLSRPLCFITVRMCTGLSGRLNVPRILLELWFLIKHLILTMDWSGAWAGNVLLMEGF